MKNSTTSTIKEIEKIYDETLKKLADLEKLQKKIIKAQIKKLEKQKVEKLQEKLKK